MKLNNDTLNLLYTSMKTAERSGLGYVSELIAFGTLAIMNDSPLHRYFLKQGMKHMEIVEKVQELYNEHFPSEEERAEEYNAIVQSAYEASMNGEAYPEEVELTKEEFENIGSTFLTIELIVEGGRRKIQITITKELYEILVTAIDIAESMYNTDTLTNHYMLAAFSEKMTDIYLELIMNCLGPNALLTSTALDKPGFEEVNQKFVLPKNLESFLTVLNNNYSPDEEYCKILGRDRETETLIRILSKATKRNAILVGYPGVGKTAIVEKFVWSIVKGTCHSRFKDALVLSLDVTSIVAGTKYRGTAEARFQELVKFLETHPGCILFMRFILCLVQVLAKMVN